MHGPQSIASLYTDHREKGEKRVKRCGTWWCTCVGWGGGGEAVCESPLLRNQITYFGSSRYTDQCASEVNGYFNDVKLLQRI